MSHKTLMVVGALVALMTFVDFISSMASILADGAIASAIVYYLWNQLPKKEATDKKVTIQ